MTENTISQAKSDGRPANETPTSALRPTPFASLLAATSAGSELAAYRGALTPRELDAPEREIEALLSGVAVHDLGWLRRIAVRGEDRFRWLSGMVTNMVNDLGTSAGAWNLVLNAQGRIQGDLHVWREGDALTLVIAADQADRLLGHLDRFIIMDDVELVPLSMDRNGDLTGETALGLTGPRAAGILAQLDLPELHEPLTSARAIWNGSEMRLLRAYGKLTPHYELWVQADQISELWQALIDFGATPTGAGSLEALRIAEAIPAYGIDIAERDLPQETSQMRALHFSKGCYLGQEIVERIRSRGNVHRHLRPLELFGPLPAPGVELTLEGGAVAGQITSAGELPLLEGRRIFALGMIRGEAELCSQSFAYKTSQAGGTARILAGTPKFETSL
jgi:folate-binding protein YgfZ